MARALWLKYILCHSKDQRSFFVVNYTLHNTMFLYLLYHRTAHKRILAKLAFAIIDYGCSLGRAKMWSSGQ